MSKKHRHIDQLSPELLKRYRQGDLPAEEMYAVEKYLLDHPFEAEALEGMEVLDAQAFDQGLDALNQQIDERTAQREDRKALFWTSTRRVAATLIILLTASFFYLWLSPTSSPDQAMTKELTVNTEEKPEEKPQNEPQTATLDTLPTQQNEALVAEQPDEEEEVILLDMEMTEEELEIDVTDLVADKVAPLPPDSLKSASGFTTEKVEAYQPAMVQRRVTISTGTAPRPVSEEKLETQTKQALDFLDTLKLERSITFDARNRDQNTSRPPAGARTFLPALEESKRKAAGPSTLITGRITDENGGAIPFVTVQLVGTIEGTTSNGLGNYYLLADTTNARLRFSMLGYETQELKLQGSLKLDVILKEDVSELNAVVTMAEEGVSKSRIRPFKRDFEDYVSDNLRYPPAARENNIKGKVVAEFLLKANGTVSDIKIIRGLGYGCDEEAIRLIKERPDWRPETDKKTSQPIDSRQRVKIKFKPK